MKKPVVDYRQFRLSKINEPRFAHLKLFFISWIGYFTLYFLTENLIPVERCHPMHCFLDDLIPFCEFFAIFYVFWYALVFGYLVYYLLYDIDKFKKLQKKSEITEDDLKDLEKDLQKLTDDYIKEVEKLTDAKEKELFEI